MTGTDAAAGAPRADAGPPAPAAPRRRGATRALVLAAKLAVSAGALLWTLSRIDTRGLLAHVLAAPAVVVAAAIALTVANLLVGAVRWRVLALAYGADPERLPGVGTLFRLYLEGLFFNTFLPGNVGGDVTRAWALGRALADPAAAGMVVVIERLLGLAGLAAVAATAATVAAIPGLDLRAGGALALAATLGAVALVSALPHLAARLPGRAGALAGKLPRLVRPGAFAGAFALSVGTQLLAAFTGHLLLGATSGLALPLARSLAIVPVAVLASYFPLSIAGIGAREAAFASLAGHLGVDGGSATAASLLILATTLMVALVGGVMALLPRPRAAEADPAAAPRPDVRR